MTANDADALGELFESLSLDDRHHCFFSVYHPSRSFLEHYSRTADDNGYGLVALVSNSDERLVGKASYTLLPSGCGELAITIAREWRGWLGPYLFDALLEAAAVHAVPVLQADILADNKAMLALARSRGGVTIKRPDLAVVRVTVPASQPVRAPSRAPRRQPAPAAATPKVSTRAVVSAGGDVVRGVRCHVAPR